MSLMFRWTRCGAVARQRACRSSGAHATARVFTIASCLNAQCADRDSEQGETLEVQEARLVSACCACFVLCWVRDLQQQATSSDSPA